MSLLTAYSGINDIEVTTAMTETMIKVEKGEKFKPELDMDHFSYYNGYDPTNNGILSSPLHESFPGLCSVLEQLFSWS